MRTLVGASEPPDHRPAIAVTTSHIGTAWTWSTDPLRSLTYGGPWSTGAGSTTVTTFVMEAS